MERSDGGGGMEEEGWRKGKEKGSPLYVPCRSMRLGSKLNQVIEAPFGGQSSDQGDLRTAGSRMHSCNLTFHLLKIKQSSAPEGNDQAISTLFADQNP